ncbi:MAG: DUF5916 domain-containing protein [candidate division WOR-3 bacterium]
MIYLLNLYFFIFSLDSTNWSPNSGEVLVINLPYLKVPPKIDGVIDEHEYLEAEILTNFTEFDPIENAKPPVETEVLIGCDEDNLYVAFKCYDDIRGLRANLMQRDKCYGDDLVGLLIDPYGDLKDAYEVLSNPMGVQVDAIMKTDEGGDDLSYDADWNVSTKIFDKFWIAEFAIPFSSLKFEGEGEKKWRINFFRIRPRESMAKYAWAPISRDKPGFISQSGILIIGEDILLKSKNLTFLPYLSSAQRGSRIEKYEQDKVNYKGGASLRYTPSSNINIDLALNPDFAEIEADAPQLQTNNPFALYYSEKRPFFYEGKSLLESKIEIIYTRSINNPLYAAKAMGNLGGNDFIFLSARDENTPWIIPFKDYSKEIPSSKSSISNIFKVERSIFDNTKLAASLSDRRVEEGFNTVYNLEGSSRFLDHYIILYQGAYSNTKEPSDTLLSRNINKDNFGDYTGAFDGEEFRGYTQLFSGGLYFRNFGGGGRYEVCSPTFRSDLGFIQKNDFKKGYIWFQPRIYPNKFGFEQVDFQFSTGKAFDFDGFREEKYYIAKLFITLMKQTELNIYHCGWDERFLGQDFYRLWFYQLEFSTSPIKTLNFYGNLFISRTVNHRESNYGYERNFYISTTLKPFPFLQMEGSYGRYRLFREKWFDEVYDESVLYTKIEYFFSSAFSLRLTVDYNGESKNLRIMPLLKYQPSPFTIFFIGANSSTLYNSYRDFELMSHQIFMKVQYEFNL